MSSMLEQAVIDAKALRKAAIESAETVIFEKYSHEIKEAVETLLEQPQEEELDIPDIPEEEGKEGGDEPTEFVDQMPSSFPTGDETTKEKLDALDDAVDDASDAFEKLQDAADELVSASLDGDEDEDIEIDFDQLEAEMEAERGEAEDLTSREEVAADVVELDESILEELSVDIEGSRSGWGNDGVPDAELAHQREKQLAAEQDTELKEENDDLKQAVAALQKENKKLNSNVLKVKKLFNNLNEEYKKVSVQNAKLLYTNKTLGSSSLNERQKKNIVEAISKATTVAEAKIIYETLQSTVGSLKETRPKSLDEAITRKTSTLLPRRKNEDSGRSVAFADRMKTLAGINQ